MREPTIDKRSVRSVSPCPPGRGAARRYAARPAPALTAVGLARDLCIDPDDSPPFLDTLNADSVSSIQMDHWCCRAALSGVLRVMSAARRAGRV